jgi:hypothetical protein
MSLWTPLRAETPSTSCLPWWGRPGAIGSPRLAKYHAFCGAKYRAFCGAKYHAFCGAKYHAFCGAKYRVFCGIWVFSRKVIGLRERLSTTGRKDRS